MMTLLRGLHAIAAQRGDGLRPEFLTMTTPSPGWAEIQRMSAITAVGTFDGKPIDEGGASAQTAEVVAMPQRKRGESR